MQPDTLDWVKTGAVSEVKKPPERWEGREEGCFFKGVKHPYATHYTSRCALRAQRNLEELQDQKTNYFRK